MLLGLIFRGVAFEFRFKAHDHERHLWDKAFIGGSTIAAFFQGVTLGFYIDGIPMIGRSYAGGAFDWVAPFPLFVGVGVVVAYTLLGCCWLIWKTEGELQRQMRTVAMPLTWSLLLIIAAISIWTPLTHEAIAERWFAMPNLLWLSPIPLLVGLAMLNLVLSIRRSHDFKPFLFALCLILLAYVGLGISLWPYVIPPEISIWDAAAPIQSQVFALVGTLAIMPLILIYTGWSYYVFRGKVRAGDGYH
jgi:cytochrome d ubiquinol oxidase subunit II